MDAVTIDDLRSTFGLQIEKLVSNSASTERAINSIKDVLLSIVKSVDDTKLLFVEKFKKDNENAYQQRDEKKTFTNLITSVKSNTDQLNEQNKRERDREKKQTSLFSKIFGPIALVLTTVAALGFGLTRFPALRQFLSNTTGSAMGNILNIAKGMFGKEVLTKEWLKNIPFIGYLVHIYDAFSFFAKGKYAEGIKELAFNIPGIDFIAPLFGTSRERLMNKSARTGEKPQGIFNFNIEDTLDNAIEKVDSFLKPVGDFFNNAISFSKDLYFAVTKGDFRSISKSLDSLATLFPILSGASAFMSGFLFKQFEITASRQGLGGKTMYELNFIDVANDLYKRTSESIGDLFSNIMKPIQNIMKALGLVFSGDITKQRAGFALLDIYFPNISTGLKVIMGAIDRINTIKEQSGGKLPIWKLLTTDIDIGQYDVPENKEAFAKLDVLKKREKDQSDRLRAQQDYEKRLKSLQDDSMENELKIQNALKELVTDEEGLKARKEYKNLFLRRDELKMQGEELIKNRPQSWKTLWETGQIDASSELLGVELDKTRKEIENLTASMRQRSFSDSETAKILRDSNIDVASIRQTIASGEGYFSGEFLEHVGDDISKIKDKIMTDSLTPVNFKEILKDDALKRSLEMPLNPLTPGFDFEQRNLQLYEYLKTALDNQEKLMREQSELQRSTTTALRDVSQSPRVIYTNVSPTNNVLTSNLAPIRAQRLSYVSGDVTNG